MAKLITTRAVGCVRARAKVTEIGLWRSTAGGSSKDYGNCFMSCRTWTSHDELLLKLGAAKNTVSHRVAPGECSVAQNQSAVCLAKLLAAQGPARWFTPPSAPAWDDGPRGGGLWAGPPAGVAPPVRGSPGCRRPDAGFARPAPTPRNLIFNGLSESRAEP